MWIVWAIAIGIMVGWASMGGLTVYIMERVGYPVGKSCTTDDGPAITILTAVLWPLCFFGIVPATLVYQGIFKRKEHREERRRKWQEAETVGKE